MAKKLVCMAIRYTTETGPLTSTVLDYTSYYTEGAIELAISDQKEHPNSIHLVVTLEEKSKKQVGVTLVALGCIMEYLPRTIQKYGKEGLTYQQFEEEVGRLQDEGILRWGSLDYSLFEKLNLEGKLNAQE